MIKSLLLLVTIISILSCKKVLERSPLDSLTPTQAFANDQDLQLYVNSFYQMLPRAQEIYGESGTVPGYYFIGDIMSDITVWTLVNTYISGGFKSQDAQGWSWTNLRNINYFLAHYQEADISADRKNYYGGIARFFRAWFYFDKVKTFGDVPWYSKVLSPTDSAALYMPRSPRTLVMDSVLADINFAVDNIISTKDNTSSTITKWVALALKSRICLFEGTFRKYHTELGLTNTSGVWLQNAADAANEIMQGGQYGIYSTNNPSKDYHNLFINENPISAEVLLAAIANNNLKKWHNATGFFSNYGKYQSSLVKRFINSYLNIDGSRFTDQTGFNNIEFQDEVKDRDQRLAQTIRTPSYRRSDGTVAPPYLSAAITGYQTLKFSLDNPIYDLNGQSYNSIPIMRYAEVLLNYAEAKAEMGTFTNDDWDNTIAVLRKRAGITNTTMPGTLDTYMKENFYTNVTSIPIMEIRRDRAIELIYEGFRYDDLLRWKEGKLLEKVKDGIYVPEENTLLDLNKDGSPDVSFVNKMPDHPVQGVYYYIVDNTITKLSDGNSGRLLLQLNLANTYPDFKYYQPLPFNELLVNKNLVQNEGWDHP